MKLRTEVGQFESDPNIVGQSIFLNSLPFTVVGIAPRGFQGTTVLRSDVWGPISMTGVAMPRNLIGLDSRQAVWLDDGWPIEGWHHHPAAQAEMDAIAAGLRREFPQE